MLHFYPFSRDFVGDKGRGMRLQWENPGAFSVFHVCLLLLCTDCRIRSLAWLFSNNKRTDLARWCNCLCTGPVMGPSDGVRRREGEEKVCVPSPPRWRFEYFPHFPRAVRGLLAGQIRFLFDVQLLILFLAFSLLLLFPGFMFNVSNCHRLVWTITAKIC